MLHIFFEGCHDPINKRLTFVTQQLKRNPIYSFIIIKQTLFN
jgi:hypothetical protein